ncbi:hypothetical protein [Kordiimonas sp.]|uniref:hypothetical protein n=1 Tax=Kordiimonas sp. TaxID=1970157 RepID=UPI003A923A0C
MHLRYGRLFAHGQIERDDAAAPVLILVPAGPVGVFGILRARHRGEFAHAGIDFIEVAGVWEAIVRGAPGTQNLVFDISGVVVPEATAKALDTDDAQIAKFVALMRKIGLDRFVLGSDWPAIGRIAPYFSLMRETLPVTDAEWSQLCGNVAPYIAASKVK